MNNTADISLFGLIVTYSLMLIPIFIFYLLRLKLIKDAIVAVIRMSVQLFLVGFYLKYLFLWNNMLVNLAWALLMIFVAAYTVLNRTKLDKKLFILPVFSAILFGLFVIDVAFMGFIIDIDYKFDSRYFIPITGMLIGNLMRADVMALKEYYDRLNQEISLYRYLLANGATQFEALLPFMRKAVEVAANPMIASTAVTGLIALPGMMTGQLLGGSPPMTAIKYQIAIIVTIFVASILTIFISLLISNKFSFDKLGNLKPNLIKS